jgi:hypothetical protein
LYAVELPEQVPLYADAKLVSFLRDQYRRKHFEEFIPDTPDGGMPEGPWYSWSGPLTTARVMPSRSKPAPRRMTS